MPDAVPRHPGMMCRVERLEYNFVTKRAIVHLPADNCVDMTGAIAAIRRIDPHCREIETYSGDLPSVSYVLEGNCWLALPPLPPYQWRPAVVWERSC